MQLRMLGTFEVLVDGCALDLGGPKQRAVLAVLATETGRTVSVDRLLDAVWQDEPPARAEASLQAYVSNLRKVLEPDRAPRTESTLLRTRPGGYSLELDPGSTDVARFESLIREARELSRSGEPTTARSRLDEAIAMWSLPLPEFEQSAFAIALRLRLADLHDAALDDRTDLLLELGEHAAILGDLEVAVTDAPLSERRWSQLALARYRSGQQTEALRVIDRARRTLADEAGLDPGPELTRLEADILVHADALQPPRRDRADPDRPTTADPSAGPPVEPSRPAPSRDLVGRDAELAELDAALDAAAAGAGRAVVISGEPGIGKTRLAEALADVARSRSVSVAWARCPESAANEPLAAIAGIGAQLASTGIVEAFSTRAPRSSGADGDDESIDPFVAAVRGLATSDRPFVAVIDDAQWADPTSLRVLERTAGDFRDTHALVVLTTRPVGPSAPSALTDCLGELARQPSTLRLSLAGLGPDAVATWIERSGPGAASEHLVEFVHERTGGNPFFVQELVALLDAERRLGHDGGALARSSRSPVPDAVADVIRRRVSRLPASTQQLLPLAAVVGRTFDADVAAAVSERSTGEILDDLDPALVAGIVIEDADTVGRFRFSHALVSEALVAELSPARRARTHAQTATAIESLRGAALSEHIVELAHHALAGALAGTGEQAIRYSSLAAERAAAIGAFEDAALHRGAVLRALELTRPGDHEARYEALLLSGKALRRSDDAGGATAAFAEAVGLAETLGDPERMAAAAVLLNEPTPWQAGDYGSDNLAEAAVVERVLSRLPDGDSTARAELTGALANYLYYREPERSDLLSADALDIARRTGEPATLMRTLNNRAQSIWRADRIHERLDLIDEMRVLAQDPTLEPDLRFLGEFSQVVAGYQVGEPPRPALERVRAIAHTCSSAAALNQMGMFETGLLAVEGRHDECERLAATTMERYRRNRRWGADAVHIALILLARIDAGRGEETLADAASVELGGYSATYVGMAAWALLEIGQHDLARATLGPEGSVGDLPDDWLWLAGNGLSGLAVAGLHDRVAAAILYERLAPFSGLIGVAGTNASLCSVDHVLGQLASTLDDLDSARTHLAAAIDIEDRVGAVAWSTRARIARAEVLRRSSGPGDAEAAQADLATARQIAQRCGLIRVLAHIDQVG